MSNNFWDLHTGIASAIARGDISLIRRLVEDKCNKVDLNSTNVYGDTPLMLAAQHGRTHICEYLLDFGADINLKQAAIFTMDYRSKGNTALHFAVLANSTETVKLLVNRKANPNIKNVLGLKAIDYCTETYVHQTNTEQFKQMLTDYQLKYESILEQSR